MPKKPQLCDMCGGRMTLTTVSGPCGRRSVYVCTCGERVKVRHGEIVAAKWYDVTLDYSLDIPLKEKRQEKG
nr:hypothetical protein [Candidatus Sigynarchaeota archaeon]